MTITEQISVMQSFAGGRKIEVSYDNEEHWQPTTEPKWNWEFSNYRIKNKNIKYPKTKFTTGDFKSIRTYLHQHKVSYDTFTLRKVISKDDKSRQVILMSKFLREASYDLLDIEEMAQFTIIGTSDIGAQMIESALDKRKAQYEKQGKIHRPAVPLKKKQTEKVDIFKDYFDK